MADFEPQSSLQAMTSAERSPSFPPSSVGAQSGIRETDMTLRESVRYCNSVMSVFGASRGLWRFAHSTGKLFPSEEWGLAVL